MIELKSPCAECDHRGLPKIKDPCKTCIKSGKPWRYCVELGGLSESVPDDVALYGNGGIEMPEYDPNSDDLEYQIMVQACSRHSVNVWNMQNGSVGAAFNRARMEIIECFIENTDKTQEEISKMVGVTQARVSQLIKSLNRQKDVENAKELKKWMMG